MWSSTVIWIQFLFWTNLVRVPGFRTPSFLKWSDFRSQRTGTSSSLYQAQSTLARGDEADPEERRLSDRRLIQSLDLIPLLHGVAAHAGTRRGRQALLALVGQDEEQPSITPKSNTDAIPSLRRRVTEVVSYRRIENKQIDHVTLAHAADSAQQARQEYELVRQAELALRNDVPDLMYPPLYGATSSPWDTATVTDTDDDEWLDLGSLEDWTLEYVLQADQVVKTLLQLHDWGNQTVTQTWMPGLATLALSIPLAELDSVENTIAGSVEIVRWRTYADPEGRKSFTFRLSESRFPSLKQLREKERELADAIEKELTAMVRKRKGTTEILQHDGRFVLSIPKVDNPSQVGVVRDAVGGRCYVEPHQIVKMGDELVRAQTALTSMEQQLQRDLIQTVLQYASAIDRGIQSMARLDVLFAKAAFGIRMHGTIPTVQQEGTIAVHSFVHPVLALVNSTTRPVVPVDLLMFSQEHRALIISGANGGGKTVALKSFGVASIMTRLGIPIPTSSTTSPAEPRPRVDWFDDVLVQVGDQQNMLEGESTWMARLHACADVLKQVNSTRGSHNDDDSSYSLVLLDELGSGTDPVAGGAIAQAVLEQLLEYDTSRVVVTTHSPRLKALSFDSPLYQCATVMLQSTAHTNHHHDDDVLDKQQPTFQLEYGAIGDSYALNAAARSSLPEAVVTRAASLLSSSQDDGAQQEALLVRALTQSLQRQVDKAHASQMSADALVRETLECRHAILSLAQAYDRQWTSYEERLQGMLQRLQEENASPLEIVGETLQTVRLVQRTVKSDEELLRERGLKRISVDHKLAVGDTVVILVPGEWEGTSATVVDIGDDNSNMDVTVQPSLDYFYSGMEHENDDQEGALLTFARYELAIWDYDSSVMQQQVLEPQSLSSVRESQQKLQNLLSSLQSTKNGTQQRRRKDENVQGRTKKSFQSSRERKTASSAAGKKKAKRRSKKK